MNFITWNVNGLRAILNKGFIDFCLNEKPDAICLQEIKLQEGQATVDLADYHEYWNYAEKKGYSGTAIFTKRKPISANNNIDAKGHDTEGRSITLDFGDFYLINEYTPNSGDGLKRLDYRMEWEDARRKYLEKLDKIKPLIICGDLNVAHTEIDLKNPKSNRKNAGFTDEERSKFDKLLDVGLTDSFRYLYPDKEGAYTWWSYRFNARSNNAGWRIDYFLVSNRIQDKIKEVTLMNDIFGSDHCPVKIEIDL